MHGFDEGAGTQCHPHPCMGRPERQLVQHCRRGGEYQRAKALNMDVMIDFHYSDWWADPAQQNKPAAWVGKNLADLKKALSDHTVSVLRELKAVGVTPKWVQVGNEIRPGMLWDKDKALSGASYDVKESDLKDAPANASSEVVYPMNYQSRRIYHYRI